MSQNNFAIKLFLILAGYGSVIIPIYGLIQYINRKCKENHPFFGHNERWWSKLLRSFAVGHPEYTLYTSAKPVVVFNKSDDGERVALPHNVNNVSHHQRITTISKIYKHNFAVDCFRIFVYFCGIQVTLITMGFFQERIITRGYLQISNPLQVDNFDDAQFLVFANRIVGCILAGAFLIYDRKQLVSCFPSKKKRKLLFSICGKVTQPVHILPLYVHSFTSISNTISSWCQYEALKYVSFPTQTVCKASKVIPTMLMGKLIRKERYSTLQYAFAFVLVTGASIFFLSMNNKNINNLSASNLTADGSSTTISGLILMAGYLALDAFTPNYQKKLMEARVSCCQMMFYVNVFSAFLCFISLLQQFTFFSSLTFILTHYEVLRDCFLLSLGSAFGQIFIYLTIEEFGPIILSVMMTLRQIFSIILSAFYFSHPISFFGGFGLFLVFGAILVDIYQKYKSRS